MDHDNSGMTSETEGKENSSTNGDHSNRLCSEEEYTNPADNDPARILQLSQPFFVADTLEDDESLIIPPTQEDSAPFMIPSTPICASKNDRTSEGDPNVSTISVLEETCVDLENKSEHDSSKEDANQISNATCNESDLTQDLDLEPTQPIILSNPPEEDFNNMSNDANKKNDDNDDDDDDDDWQLKFSETQTQDLLNFEKNNEKEKEVENKLPDTSVLSKEPEKKDEEKDDDDDGLPATLSIEVPERLDEKDYDNSMSKVKQNENVEVVEIQSDDEIEPSQSCLSEYKGETISTSFKVQASVDIHNSKGSVDEIPKLESETGFESKESVKDEADIEIVSEGETRTINLSESKDMLDAESKGVLDDKSLSIEEISIEEKKDDKKVKLKENWINDREENERKELNENMEVEIVQDIKEKSLPEHKSDTINSSLKTKDLELLEANGELVEDIKYSKGGGIEEIELVGEQSAKITERGPQDLNSNYESQIAKCHELVAEELSNVSKLKEESVEGVEVMVVDSESKMELREKSAEEKASAKLNINESDKSEKAEVEKTVKEAEVEKTVKEAELVKENVSENLEAGDVEKSPKTSQDVSTIAETDKTRNTELTPVIDLHPNKLPSEVEQDSTKQVADGKIETPPTSFIVPLPGRSYGSTRKKLQNKGFYPEASITYRSDKKVSIGSYKDIKSLEKFFKSIGISLDKEKLETILSKKTEEFEIRPVFSLANQTIFLREYSIESEHHRQDSGVSPISSSSTTTSSTLSSKASIHSGEMADISSSLSGKSNSCGIQMDSTAQSINILSSQDTALEMLPKTSTQISHEPIIFSDVFGKRGSVESKSKSDVSPIKSPVKTAKTSNPKRKRGGKKTESSSNEASGSNEPKRKRGKAVKTKGSVEDKGEETEESKDMVIEVKPRKAARRKKGATDVPDNKPEDIKLPVDDVEMTTEDDASIQEEANFGSILPGVKVMARWKDGYYYSGMVQSQELDGKWAVQFEDGFLRTIAPENLIKIAILPKGTSVLVQSPDDFYDPGIVCGHFREGNKVGYEVELDNGVTRRYARSAVILSGDQAKVIMSNRPPTTPATMTINLDNIIDGKRKRKSVQSPVASPVAKKSPRITRSKKPDSNLESTAESSVAEVISVKSKDSENEEPAPKKNKTRKGTKKKPATSKNSKSTTADSSNISKATAADSSNSSKITKVLPQRSARKLFKDYAFLLTNADRKVAVKPPDSSDSESIREEEDIVPFNKDELCEHITSGGGIILEKFDDIKKCTRKHIYLLANSFLRTMKYIQCIAAGISCIKHHWVQNCLFKSEILSVNSYMLPSGFSLVSQKVIEWHGKTDVFKGCKIALVSAPESPFVYTWAPVLLAAKADFVQKWSLPSSVSGCSLVVDVLITNHHCPPDIIQSAKKRKIPIVSSEWIIQCLIMGKPLPFDAHPKFKYDYAEK